MSEAVEPSNPLGSGEEPISSPKPVFKYVCLNEQCFFQAESQKRLATIRTNVDYLMAPKEVQHILNHGCAPGHRLVQR